RGLARELLETPRAIGIVELVPVGAIVERDAARRFERPDLGLVRHSRGRNEPERGHREQRGRQCRAEDKTQIRQHSIHRPRRPVWRCAQEATCAWKIDNWRKQDAGTGDTPDRDSSQESIAESETPGDQKRFGRPSPPPPMAGSTRLRLRTIIRGKA